MTIEDVRQILLKYILPLFDSRTSNHVIVTSCSKSQEIANSFFLMGHPSKIIKLQDVYANNIFQQPILE